MGKFVRHESGIALVIVLWITALLTVIAGSFVYSARNAALTGANIVIVAKLRALSDAGIQYGLYELTKPVAYADRWKTDGTPNHLILGDVDVSVAMRDESAKIDLNAANESLLKGLMLSRGLSEERASALIDAILDWRDPDDLVRPLGAERDQYEARGLPYTPANAPFQAVDELQRVIGMTPELYRDLEGALTVYSKLPGINSTLASREVLLALPVATAADVDAYISSREQMLAAGLTPEPFPQASGFESAATNQVYNIRSISLARDGSRFIREAIVKVVPGSKSPYIIQFLQDGRP